MSGPTYDIRIVLYTLYTLHSSDSQYDQRIATEGQALRFRSDNLRLQ